MFLILINYVLCVMIYMIVIDDLAVYNRDDMDTFINYFKNTANTRQQKESARIIEKYLNGVWDAYVRLKDMVRTKLSKQLEPIVFLPYDEVHNFDSFSFDLINIDFPNEKITQRERLAYNQLCDVCFGGVPGLFTLSLVEE